MSAEEVWIYRKTTAVTDRRYKEQQVLQRSRIFVNQNDHFRQIPNAVWPKRATLSRSAWVALRRFSQRHGKLIVERPGVQLVKDHLDGFWRVASWNYFPRGCLPRKSP
ncbi:MAG TPA: hypothetical protein DCQ92_09785 [Verrucomicrobia subdivision 3 bacterium]|nr:hypothetical protein [Limisphaerales bacterium]